MLKRLTCLCLASVACGKEDEGLDFDGATEAIIGGSFRTPENAPVSGARITIGAADLSPDPAGVFRFPELLPGRLVVRSDIAGYTRAASAVPLETGLTSAMRLVAAPRVTEERDSAAEVAFADGALSIRIPGGALLLDGAPATGPATFSFLPLGDGDLVTPGSRIWLRSDQFEEPFDPFIAFELAAPELAGRELDLAPEVATVTWTVGADWPHADRADLGLYVFDVSEAWWKKARSVEVVDGVITVPFASFGWLAIGAQGADTGCLTGTILRDGSPIHGAEITASEAGRPGVDRVYTNLDGDFCVRTAGAPVDLAVFAWGDLGDVLGTGAATGVGAGTGCGEVSSCASIGAVAVDWRNDSDGDGFWPGEGDCDDGDLANNPIDSGDLCIGG